MRERHFWLDLAFISLVLSLLQLPFTPSRFGGVFFFALTIGCVGEWAMLGYCDKSKVCAVVSVVGRVLFGLFVLSFAFIQLFIIQRGMVADARAKTADYVLVLGALVNPDGRPSDTLAARCDTAVSVLETNPQSKAVLCGGQGWNEPCTEASSMSAYMIAQGIPAERLLLEEESSNTIQNIRNAVVLVQRDLARSPRGGRTNRANAVDADETDSRNADADVDTEAEDITIAVITSDYHLARARVLMAHAAALPPLGIPAPTPHPWQWLSMRCREYCSILGLMLSQRWHI